MRAFHLAFGREMFFLDFHIARVSASAKITLATSLTKAKLIAYFLLQDECRGVPRIP